VPLARLVDELSCAVDDPVGALLKHSPLLRRINLVDWRLVHERLLILEKVDNVINELSRLHWCRVVEATDSFLEQNTADCCSGTEPKT